MSALPFRRLDRRSPALGLGFWANGRPREGTRPSYLRLSALGHSGGHFITDTRTQHVVPVQSRWVRAHLLSGDRMPIADPGGSEPRGRARRSRSPASSRRGRAQQNTNRDRSGRHHRAPKAKLALLAPRQASESEMRCGEDMLRPLGAFGTQAPSLLASGSREALQRKVLSSPPGISFGQCKTFTIKTKNPGQPGPPTSPSPRGSPRTWLCGSSVGPELVTGSPARAEGGFWGRRLSGACGRCKNPREAGRAALRVVGTDSRAKKLSLAARRAPARLPSNRQPIAAGPQPFYGSGPPPSPCAPPPRGGAEVCSERQPIGAAVSRSAPSRRPRAGRRP
uniref:Uncharacterized protein n=1 Tax=Rangifer tarandus platyrhynchus TaxID=3082113 RepID=A0ACB0F729_RANTA|nr:unnamed protein product [Rangifer tarandus platyrhynchus]